MLPSVVPTRRSIANSASCTDNVSSYCSAADKPFASDAIAKRRGHSVSGRSTYVFHDLREAVNMLEELERTARRVLGGAHPDTMGIEKSLRYARAVLHARETPPGSA
jgi:hypothetical protein